MEQSEKKFTVTIKSGEEYEVIIRREQEMRRTSINQGRTFWNAYWDGRCQNNYNEFTSLESAERELREYCAAEGLEIKEV